MADVAIKETRNGSDFIREGNDFAVTNSLFNQVYLALFGGNPSGLTSDQTEGKFRTDWWGNELLFPGDPDSQFNSVFQSALFSENALGSGAITRLEAAMKADLGFLRQLAEVGVSVIQETDSRVRISVLLIEPDTLTQSVFVFLWDGTKTEPITVERAEDDVPTEPTADVMAEGNTIITFEGESFKFF